MKKRVLPLLLSAVILLTVGCSSKINNKDVKVSTDNKDTTNTETSITPTPTTKVVLPEEETKEDILYPAYKIVNDEKKYGYIDVNNNFVIEPIYQSASDFSEGFAVVTDDSYNYFLIDSTGKVIFESPYSISQFKNGTAVISIDTEKEMKKGYIDSSGKMIIESVYDFADSFNSNNQAFVYDDNTVSIIDKTGTVLESYNINFEDININSEDINIEQFQDGYIVFSNDSGIGGVMNYKGENLLSFDFNSDYSIYSAIRYLGNDLFAVMKEVEEGKEYLSPSFRPFALFNSKGEQLTDYTLYEISTFTEGYASVTDDTSTYFINTSGQEATDLPKLEGRGTMKIIGNLIEAEIDASLFYLKKDGTITWNYSNEILLPSGIKVKSLKFKANKYVLVNYPVLEGMTSEDIQASINDRLKEIFVEPRVGLKEDAELSVDDNFNASQQGNLLIIEQNGYDFYFGAAHGMPIREYYYIDLTTGELYSLPNLFKKDTDYISPINAIIEKSIADANPEENYYFEDSFDSIADDQYFYLDKDGIVIYFYPYDIAPYAAGFPEFKIPFDKLTNVLDTEGAFWKAFHQ